MAMIAINQMDESVWAHLLKYAWHCWEVRTFNLEAGIGGTSSAKTHRLLLNGMA